MRGGRIQGFALIMAVFLIVTLAAIGVYLVTMSTGQVQAVSQDEQAVRAYQAARAGLEWVTYRRLRNSVCPASPPAFTNPGLSGFHAETTCVQVGSETEGVTPVAVYLITSKGCNAAVCTPASPAATYVERELQITITQ
ncbi:MAG: biosis protein MshP [Betaproteobacteria bacterium]|jgi:MSHA biogenesis protein MshP|nr:biosis protein MshP [Betaproteobacteria bacterium]